MAGQQKGTEFALCLNSFNRDTRAYPQSNDFTLELKDRYDLQMMVLGSLELPYNQFLVEEPWSHFSYDYGLSIYSLESRSIRFNTTTGHEEDVVMLPAPYLPVERTEPNIYSNADHIAHGLGPNSLDAFPEGSLRVVLIPDSVPGGGAPFETLEVVKVISSTHVQVENSAPPSSSRGLLVATTENTRTFSSPEFLVNCLRIYCRTPFAGNQFLTRLQFSYCSETMDLSLEVSPSIHQAPCSPLHPEASQPLSVNPQAENLLSALGFNLPRSNSFTLPRHLLSCNYPVQRTCLPSQRLAARGLPAQPECVKYSNANPPDCLQTQGPPCREPAVNVPRVQIPPGNYEPNMLQKLTEHRINNKAFLEIPVLPMNQTNSVRVYQWGSGPANFDQVDLAPFPGPPLSSFHPGGVAKLLTVLFTQAGSTTPLVWTYERDRYVVRPLVSGTVFRIVWPPNDTLQMIAFRLRMDDNVMYATELQSEPLDFCAEPTMVTLPSMYNGAQISTTKQLVFCARPRLIPGSHTNVLTVPVIDIVPPNDMVLRIDLGALPLETPVFVYNSNMYDTDNPRFGYVACNSTALDATYVVLLDNDPAMPQITPEWRVAAIPMRGGAFNIYFPRRQARCWSRLAEIYGFRSGANLWSSPALVTPWQWNLEAPAYILLDLGLQHVSATISHRCGDDMMSQFFGKIVLYPPFKEMRMTPIQAIGTGVSVVSSLHLRLLNPWHQLYELHGRNWSLTLILASNTKGGRTDCL